MYNSAEFKVCGPSALFSDPVTRIGGEKSSYMVPSYQALIGVADGVYFKPTFHYFIDEVRIMKPIRMQTKASTYKTYSENDGDLVIYTYLKDVEYRVKCHFEWNMARTDLQDDRDDRKHHNILQRYLKKGGKRDIFLGTRECAGYVEPCDFNEGTGAYDQVELIDFGVMFHGFNYPNAEKQKLTARFWRAKMEYGIIRFPRPEDCDSHLTREIRDYKYKIINSSPERKSFENEDVL